MLFTEALVAMGPVVAPWPQVEIGPRSPGGRFVVGAFMPPALLNHDVVAALSRVVLSRPDAILMLKHAVMDDPVIQRVIAARFLAHGVARDRLDFRGMAGPELDQFDFDDTDLAIDSRPSMGETQLLALLARGVPVLCAGGPTTRGRLNVAPLQALGLRELITGDLDAAAARAIELAGAPEALAAIRSKIEQAFAASAYGESARVTRELEKAFRDIVERRSRQSKSLKDLLNRVA
jgi:predicted O-linked N-acetylglucosamine transferase (SPINDLY family)